LTRSMSFIPYGRHLVESDDIEAVTAVLKGDFLTTGPTISAFEGALAKRVRSRHTIVCSSGTAALHLAMLALGLGPGDAVIVPSITFLATANAARYVGADVIFSDVDPQTGLMRPSDFKKALDSSSAQIKAVLPVHLAGQSPDLPGISEIALKRKISVIEDACHALGSTYPIEKGVAFAGSCSHSDIAVFSFHPVKTIAMGEGGALTTNDENIAERLQLFRNHGIVREPGDFINQEMAFDVPDAANPWYYEMQEIGFNYRANDINCALGLSQLEKFERFSKRRKKLSTLYDVALEELSTIVRPIGRMPGCNPVWHLYVVLIDFEKARISRATLMGLLHKNGIGTQVHYIPVHRQPYYQKLYGDVSLPGADQYYAQCLTLPLFPEMKDVDVNRVVGTLTSILEKGLV